jgi:hypothetical protein
VPNHKVTAVDPNPPRSWSSQKGGPMLSYRVDLLREEDGFAIRNVEWSKKQGSPPPQIGETVDCTVDTEAQYGPKLKVNFQQGGFGGGGGNRMTPEREAQIIRQHSQHMALLHISNLIAQGRTADVPVNPEALTKIIDFFANDAKAATP